MGSPAEQPQVKQSLDVTGLPAAAVRALESLVSVLKKQSVPEGDVPPQFSSREEWQKAIREWAESHPPAQHFVDDSRESIYAGRGE